MGIRQDIKESLKDFHITKIDGQPTKEDLLKLRQELCEATASIPTTNGGGMHVYVGMLLEDAEYTAFSQGGLQFIVPTNPGPYPANVDAYAVILERQVAEHKAELAEFETYLAIQSAL